jgi:hypothetical protein
MTPADLEGFVPGLEELFDAFVILGSIYDPSTGQTHSQVFQHGNHYAILGMIEDFKEVHSARNIADEVNHGEEE